MPLAPALSALLRSTATPLLHTRALLTSSILFSEHSNRDSPPHLTTASTLKAGALGLLKTSPKASSRRRQRASQSVRTTARLRDRRDPTRTGLWINEPLLLSIQYHLGDFERVGDPSVAGVFNPLRPEDDSEVVFETPGDLTVAGVFEVLHRASDSEAAASWTSVVPDDASEFAQAIASAFSKNLTKDEREEDAPTEPITSDSTSTFEKEESVKTARGIEEALEMGLPPSSNWEALKKTLKVNVSMNGNASFSRGQKRKRDSDHSETLEALGEASTLADRLRARALGKAPTLADRLRARAGRSVETAAEDEDEVAPEDVVPPVLSVTPVTPNPLREDMRRLVVGDLGSKSQTPDQGKYVGIDCEMVGVGELGERSSLARVSVVNYHGAVLLDAYVEQVERVVDYRTPYSGIRPDDLKDASTFKIVQQKVADLMKDRIVVGHSLSEDLKVLLLSHPQQFTRDTQKYPALRRVGSSKKPALRHLVRLELGLTIQDGEHNPVIDARAAMALFRLHKAEWDRSLPASHHLINPYKTKNPKPEKKEDKEKTEGNEEKEVKEKTEDKKKKEDTVKTEAKEQKKNAKEKVNGGGRVGVSSGLSTIVRAKPQPGMAVNMRVPAQPEPNQAELEKAWWETLDEPEPAEGNWPANNDGAPRHSVSRAKDVPPHKDRPVPPVFVPTARRYTLEERKRRHDAAVARMEAERMVQVGGSMLLQDEARSRVEAEP